MTQVVLHYAHIFEFVCFTFSFNQIQLQTYQSDPYRQKHKWLKSHYLFNEVSFQIFSLMLLSFSLDKRISKTR